MNSFNFYVSSEVQGSLRDIPFQILYNKSLDLYYCEMGFKLFSYEELRLLITHVKLKLVWLHEAVIERGTVLRTLCFEDREARIWRK